MYEYIIMLHIKAETVNSSRCTTMFVQNLIIVRIIDVETLHKTVVHFGITYGLKLILTEYFKINFIQ